MTPLGATTFETPIGCCGVAWSERGLVAVQLPEPTASATRARLLGRRPGAELVAPPAWAATAIGWMQALLAGEDVDLGLVAVDLEGVPVFDRRVYDEARTIRRGITLTYGEVARRIGEPSAAQAVGQALGRNPVPIVVPCHRVVGADGAMVGFSASGGIDTKRRMLAIEGALDEPLRLFGPAR